MPAFSIRNPTCVGPIRRREALAVDDFEFLRRHTDRPIKVTLPGPYLLTRAMWVKEVSREIYPTKEDLGEDVVRLLGEEVRELTDAGVAFIQLDEPVLTELVFTQGNTRTFMCAALAARKDPAEELAFAVSLINRVVSPLRDRPGRPTIGLHVCRGNWSQDETTLLRGSYHPLTTYFRQMEVDQLVLEYATPRAGDFVPVDGKSIGLGVVNPRVPEHRVGGGYRQPRGWGAPARSRRQDFPEPRLRLRDVHQPRHEQRGSGLHEDCRDGRSGGDLKGQVRLG